YAERAPQGSRGQFIFRRAPGLVDVFQLGAGDHRGALLMGDTLFIVHDDAIIPVTKSGSTYTLGTTTGTVPGTGRVIGARNMRAPNAQAVFVTDVGVSVLENGVVTGLIDPDLPSVNSVTYLDGYFVFTTPDGRAFASGLND